MAASHHGHVEVVRDLLKHETVDVNAKDNGDNTAPNVASQHGRVEVVRELVQHDTVDVNAQDKLGRTAFLWASHGGGGGAVGDCSRNPQTPRCRRQCRRHSR
jgi:ankyrin repeat protein